MVKLQYDNNQQFKVTLPKQILMAIGWQKGDELKITLDADGKLVLHKEKKEAKK
jgi:AbrB family looped-hinge helix DNA binding protein